MIETRDLHKHFKIYRHRRGMWGALRNLTSREYRLVRAVDGIDLSIQPGELVGYLGPNGAGKSTTIKMLTGLLVPTAGEIKVNGRIPWKERREHVAHIGAVFGQRTTLWWDLPVIDSLELLRHVYHVPIDRFRRNLNDFREMLEMDPFLNTPVRSLSLGQRMRADLCAAMLHEPVLLFLDEPTIGLDVVAKNRIRQFIRRVNHERGTTIMLTTHDLSDVERLCSRVIIIDQGRLVYDGGLDNLRTRFGGERQLVVDFADEYEQAEIEGTKLVARTGTRVTYTFPQGSITASELIGRISSQYRIRDLEVRQAPIEDTIRRIYEYQLLKPNNSQPEK